MKPGRPFIAAISFFFRSCSGAAFLKTNLPRGDQFADTL